MIDITNYPKDSYPADWRATTDSNAYDWNPTPGVSLYMSVDLTAKADGITPARLNQAYNIKGFGTGFQPNYVPNPINNNIDQPDPDAEGTWKESRFLYPRGY